MKKLVLDLFQMDKLGKDHFIGKGVVLMPCYVNSGVYIDEGTMMDTFSRAGSCCQIGKNCHISAGSGIGGVLEPLKLCYYN